MQGKTPARFTCATIGLMLLSSCGSGERATVTVSYDAQSKPEEWRFPGAGRKDVEDAFKRFSEGHGYTCRPDFKNPKNTTCRGPMDLFLEFQPSLNKPEFVATFGWVDSTDRTHDEFVRHVTDFKSYMGTVVGKQSVQSTE